MKKIEVGDRVIIKENSITKQLWFLFSAKGVGVVLNSDPIPKIKISEDHFYIKLDDGSKHWIHKTILEIDINWYRDNKLGELGI